MANTDPEDAEVETEFKRIEHERIAHERAEAREDIESADPNHAADQSPQAWQLIALAAALAVGLVAALFASRWQPPVHSPPPVPASRP
ncbi:MAG: hypothetical protein ACK54F_11895 [Planctomycetia bacterium]|jgi:anti-sigma-K factor RskA